MCVTKLLFKVVAANSVSSDPSSPNNSHSNGLWSHAFSLILECAVQHPLLFSVVGQGGVPELFVQVHRLDLSVVTINV